MKATYTGYKELKGNGNWRCYFLMDDDGVEWRQDCQIVNKGAPTKEQLTEGGNKLIAIFEQQKLDKIEQEKPETKLKAVIRDLSLFKDELTDAAIKLKIDALTSSVEAK